MENTLVKSKPKPKPLTDKNVFICNLLAQYKTAPEIVKLYKETHNEETTNKFVYSIKKANQEFIEKQRAIYLANLSDVPIAQEKIRLERDEELYKLALTIESPKESIYAALGCLKEAREETKKVESGNNFIQFNQFNTLSDDELLEKKRRLEEKIISIKGVVVN